MTSLGSPCDLITFLCVVLQLIKNQKLSSIKGLYCPKDPEAFPDRSAAIPVDSFKTFQEDRTAGGDLMLNVRFRIWGLGFRVKDFGFRISGLGFRVSETAASL